MSIKIFNIKIFIYSLLIFIAAISFVLLQLPLTSTFGYEFALIHALIFFFLGGITNLIRIKKQLPLKLYLKFSILILAIPLIIVLIVSLFRDICSFWFGFSFYIIISFIAFWISFFLSEIIHSIFNKYHKSIFLFCFIVLASIPLFEIYFNPQVYFFSPIIGYFPGTIYDEDLNITISLIVYRILNIIYFAGFYLLIRGNLIEKKILITLFLITGVLFHWFSSDLGYSTTHKKLNEILKARIETKNFIIHYDNSVIDSVTIKIIALNHEYFFERLSSGLGFSPKEKINSFIFNNAPQKKIYFGSEQADIAKPWLNEIYISKDSWEKTLKHELTHIFSAEIGKGIFRLADSFNPALIEGFAEAIDNNYDDIDLHTVAASAFHYGYKIDIKELFSGLNFFKTFSGLSYLYAGSFTKYLIDNYGIKSFSIFYKTGNSQKAFGKSIDRLATDYLEFLKGSPVLLSAEQTEYYFARQSIFQKVCPRQIASDLKKADKFFIEKKYSKAEIIYYSILEKSPNYSAITGLINLYFEQKKYFQIKSLLEKHLNNFNRTPYFFNLKLLEADTRVLTEDETNALQIYNFLIDKNPHIKLKLLSELRIELMKNNLLKTYLEANDSLKYKLLIDLNRKKILTSSILSMISLAERLKIPSNKLVESFHSPLIPQYYQEAYVQFMFSKYLLLNDDLINARKLASLALRKSSGSIYYISIQEQFEKCNWFIRNHNIFDKKIEEQK